MTVSFKGIPAQYAKFLTSLAGLAVVYLQQYGMAWHTVPAITAIGAALAVFGVPNAPKPTSPVVPSAPSSNPQSVAVVPPAVPPPAA